MRKELFDSLSKESTDLHMHTCYCDGRDTPEDMIKSAIDKGLSCVGVAFHSTVDFDREYSISEENVPKMKEELRLLREKYKDEIQVLSGIEKDYYCTYDEGGYDYVIGSVHYINIDGEYFAFDQSKESLIKLADEKFGGDMYLVCEKYYAMVEELPERCAADIVGHFDLITKYNGDGSLFDISDERYIKASRKAAKKLAEAGLIFEINTGAISRGYTDKPYPEDSLYEYIKSLGADFVLSSDAHKKENVAYKFKDFLHLLPR